jgi:hypothetical protein
MNYYSFDSDGNIQNVGTCLESVFHLYKSDDVTYVAGIASSNINYVLNGVLKEYTPEELTLKSNSPGLGYKWIGKDRVWVDVNSRELTENVVKEKRNQLLFDSDWTQIPNNPLTAQQQTNWATYRQQLRDITIQSGYPFNIAWPTKPQG